MLGRLVSVGAILIEQGVEIDPWEYRWRSECVMTNGGSTAKHIVVAPEASARLGGRRCDILVRVEGGCGGG